MIEVAPSRPWTYCSRCGEKFWGCPHHGTLAYDITAAEAERIRARYALGKLHNPEHDTANYRD